MPSFGTKPARSAGDPGKILVTLSLSPPFSHRNPSIYDPNAGQSTTAGEEAETGENFGSPPYASAQDLSRSSGKGTGWITTLRTPLALRSTSRIMPGDALCPCNCALDPSPGGFPSTATISSPLWMPA